MAPAAVQLNGQVEALALHGGKKARQLLGVHIAGRRAAVLAHARAAGDDDHPIDGTRPSGEKIGMPGLAKQDDLGVGVGCPQGGQGREGEDEVAQGIGPQDGDLLDILEPGVRPIV